MTIRFRSTAAPPIATSKGCARHSKSWLMISTPSKRFTASATATENNSLLPHFSALTWRILAFTALAFILLTAGVVLVQSSGRGLVEERVNGVPQQAVLLAST